MKNSLADLNNHLFAQMERLSSENLTAEQLQHELDRTKGLTVMSREIISNAQLVLDGAKAVSDGLLLEAPAVLGLEKK